MNRFTLRSLLFLAVLSTAAPTEARAQWNTSLNLTSTYDDNSFAFFDKRADVYHQMFLGLSKDFSTDYTFTQPFYYGALVLFRTYEERTYHQHLLGSVTIIQLDHRDDGEEEEVEEEEEEEEEDSTDTEDAGDEDDAASDSSDTGGDSTRAIPARRASLHRRPSPVVRGPALRAEETQAVSDSVVSYLQLKPSLGGRFDRHAFRMYDYTAATFLGSLRVRIAGPLLLRTQGEVEFKRFPYFKQFTHFEYNGTVTSSAKLDAGPELFASANYGWKSYSETMSDTVFLSTGNSGKGKGGVKPGKKQISQYSTPSTSQLVLGGGIVQQVGGGTLSLSVLRRLTPGNQARYVDRRGVVDASEDAFFDDRYGYQGYELQFGASFPLFRSVTATIEAGLDRKVYPATASDVSGENVLGDPQRIDMRPGFAVQMTVPLLRKADGSTLLSAGAGYRFIRNQSNDAYHDYHIHQASLTLEGGF
ncbi:MAG: hypothetical protein IPP94_00900 [Ignavibacteria bacterium]|nr:hypothetical protein [Ignavibacteria bacterium]